MTSLSPEMYRELVPLVTVFVVLLGGCIGSFLNVVVWRLPRGESLSHPPSRCPKCGTPIKPWHNLPVLGWLILRGRCAACALPIAARYPLVEAATALLFAAVWWQVVRSGLPWVEAVRGCALMAFLVAAALTDWDCRLVPDPLVLAGLVWAGGTALVWPAAVHGLGGSSLAELGGLDIVSAGGAALAAAAGWVPGPRGHALLLVGGGLVVGGGLLAGLRFVTNTLWGGLPLPALETGSPVRLTAAGLAVGAAPAQPLAGWRPAGAEWVRLWLAEPTVGAGFPPRRPGRLLVVDWHADGWVCGTRFLEPAADAWLAGRLVRAEGRRETLGLGDVKMMAVLGAFLGADALLVALLPSCLLALLGECFFSRHRQRHPERCAVGIPFALWLAVGGALIFFFGDRLVLSAGTIILGLRLSAGVL